ncbi:MAG: sugar ABC transporter substrate-binding protein [Eubacterium sp.]|nr:sugar ABC transporter substrate-binding protein [Eubacterium sp.]
MLKKRVFATLLAGAMVAGLAGCGSAAAPAASGSTSASSAKAESTAAASTSAEAEAPAEGTKDYKIGLSIMELTAYTWFQGVAEGANQWQEENGAANGVNFTFDVEDSHSDVQTMLTNLENMQAAGCNGIIVAPADASSAIPTLKEAVGNGIPCVVVDYRQDTQDPDDMVWSTFVGHDMTALGKRAGDAAVEYLDTLGKDDPTLLFITVPQSGQTSADRFNGFKETVLAKYPNAKIIEEGDTGAHTRDSEQTLMENVLQRESSIDVVCGHNDAEVVGAYNAAKAQGRTDMKFIGIAGDKDVLTWLQDGDEQWIGEVLQDPVVLGYQATDAMYRTLVKGEELPDDYELPEPELITKENIADYDWQNWAWLG